LRALDAEQNIEEEKNLKTLAVTEENIFRLSDKQKSRERLFLTSTFRE